MEYFTPAARALSFLLSFDALGRDPTTGQLIIKREALEQALAYYRSLHLTQVRSNLFIGSDIVSSWNKQSNLRDAFIEDRVLFWIDRIDERGQLALDKTLDRGGVRYFEDHVGIALIPSAYAGKPGQINSAYPEVFVITAESFSGRRNQDAACELLAKTMSAAVLAPELIVDSATPLNTAEHTTDSASDQMVYLQDYLHQVLFTFYLTAGSYQDQGHTHFLLSHSTDCRHLPNADRWQRLACQRLVMRRHTPLKPGPIVAYCIQRLHPVSSYLQRCPFLLLFHLRFQFCQ